MEGYHKTLLAPFLNIEVPIFFDEKERPYSPAIFYSRLLGLNHSYEMQLVQHIMLRYQMRAFTIQRRGHMWREWTFPYPVALTMWLGGVYKRVNHTEWLDPLDQFVDWGMEVMSKAQDDMEDRFLQTRKQIIEVATAIAEIETHMGHVREMEGRISPSQRVRLWTVDARWQDFRERAGAFIQGWMVANDGKIGVMQPVYTDEGISEDTLGPITLFASVSQEDYDTFHGYVQELKQFMPDIKALFDDLGR